MKTLWLTIVLGIALLAFSGCNKETESSTSGGTATGASDKEQPKPAGSGPFAAWDLSAINAGWQGAWSVAGSLSGSREAWDVKAGKVTIWNGKREKTLDFVVTSPCTVKTIEKSAGGSSSTVHHFAMSGDKLYIGLGDAGLKKGSQAVACVSNKAWTLDASGTCQQLEPSMFEDGKWKPTPGDCKFKKDGDKDVFVVVNNGRETSLLVLGDILASKQMSANLANKFADFAAAKAALETKK